MPKEKEQKGDATVSVDLSTMSRLALQLLHLGDYRYTGHINSTWLDAMHFLLIEIPCILEMKEDESLPIIEKFGEQLAYVFDNANGTLHMSGAENETTETKKGRNESLWIPYKAVCGFLEVMHGKKSSIKFQHRVSEIASLLLQMMPETLMTAYPAASVEFLLKTMAPEIMDVTRTLQTKIQAKSPESAV